MNNSRRKQIASSLWFLCKARLNLKALYEKEKAISKLIPDDEDHEDIISNLDEYFSNIGEALISLDDAISALENADF